MYRHTDCPIHENKKTQDYQTYALAFTLEHKKTRNTDKLIDPQTKTQKHKKKQTYTLAFT